jgi:hypothetical protein
MEQTFLFWSPRVSGRHYFALGFILPSNPMKNTSKRDYELLLFLTLSRKGDSDMINELSWTLPSGLGEDMGLQNT